MNSPILKSINKRFFRPRWKNFLKQNKNGELFIHGTPLRSLEAKFGTPLYVYSEDEIRRRFQRMKNVFSAYPKIGFQYPCKINSNLAILKIAREEGFHIDASSVGEIILALLADFEPEEITLTNLYKSDQDIYFAANVGIKYLTVDYLEEISKINIIGARLKKPIDIMIRVNPMIQFGNYSTLSHKYGIPWSQAKKAIDLAVGKKYINLKGFHFHGGYISHQKTFFEAAKALTKLAGYAQEKGVKIEVIDLGGGFPRETMTKKVFQPEDMGDRFIKYFVSQLKKNGIENLPSLVFEPGKFILSAAGMGLMSVISAKLLKNNLHMAVTDGSTYGFVPDLLFDPKLQYDILPVSKMNSPRVHAYTIAGLTCDHWDVLAKKRKLPKTEINDLLAIMDIGAYSHVLASNFNNMKRAPIVLVNSSGKVKLIRRRDRYSEMFAPELDVLKIADPFELKKYYDLSRVNLKKLWS